MLIFYSDPHLGVNRRANTTQESRERLASRLLSVPTAALKKLNKDKLADVFCLGDLFDSYSNKESVIVDALKLMELTDVVIGGNHDLLNSTKSVSSLHLVSEVYEDKVVTADVSMASYAKFQSDTDEAVIYAVPHHSSQRLFEIAMEDAAADLKREKPEGYVAMLLLHCNYDMPEEVIKNDVTLNLLSEDAEYLLDSGFDYILLGHDHHSKEKKGGAVRLLGNTMPTSFSDIGDKYITTYSKDSGFEKHLIWWKDSGYLQLDINKHDEWPAPKDSIEFIEVTGAVTPENRAESVRIIRSLFSEYSNVLAVRDSVTTEELSEIVDSTDEGKVTTAHTIHSLVEASLKGTDLYDLWHDVTKQIKGE